MKMTKWLLLIVTMHLVNPVFAGAICEVALWKGSVIDYVFLNGLEHPFQLQEKAEAMLAEKGYDNYDRGLDIRHARGQTYLNHGYAVILEAKYIPLYRKVQKERRSIGCGFSNKSIKDATWDALRDMQRFDWSWKPDRDGYTVLKQFQF